MLTYKITLRRTNGRFVKETARSSRYAAKKVAARWEEVYDDSYYVEITVPSPNNTEDPQ